MNYMSPLQRRTQIIMAGMELVRASGFQAISLERIAIRLGVSGSLVRHYFGNKDALISAIVDHAKITAAHDVTRMAKDWALIK